MSFQRAASERIYLFFYPPSYHILTSYFLRTVPDRAEHYTETHPPAPSEPYRPLSTTMLEILASAFAKGAPSAPKSLA